MKNWSLRTVVFFAFVAIVTVFFSATSVMAQVTTGSIRGVITDSNGAVVAGATIKVKNEGTGVESTITTNNSGIFQSGSLLPGNYTVSVQAANFKRYVKTGVVVGIGNVVSVDTSLEIGNVGETVTVTSNSEEVLQTEQSQISGSIDSRRIEDLPSNGANGGLDTLALLIPGVVANRVGGTNTNGTGLSVNGNRGRSNNFQIDGADNNDLSVGGPALFVGFADAIQELQVTTSNFDAGAGRNQGAVVNYVTKGGTNDLHGSAFWHHQDAAVLNSLDNISKRGGQVLKNPQDLYNVYGFTVGGPILFPAFGEGGKKIWNGRDKAFFFFGYQGTRNPAQTISRSNSLGILSSEFSRLQAAFPGNAVINTIITASPFAIGPSPRYGAIGINTTSAGTAVPTQFNLTPPMLPPGQTPCPRFAPVGPATRPECGVYTTFINPATGQPFLTGGAFDALNFGTAAAPLLIQAAQYERPGQLGSISDDIVFRFDIVASRKDNITFRFFDQQSEFNNGVGNIASGFTGQLPVGSRNFGGSWAHTFSNSLLNDFRASYQEIGVEFGGGCDIAVIGCIPPPGNIDIAFANITFPVALGITKTQALPTIGPATNIPQGRTAKVYQYADTLNVVKGKHSVRFGAEYKALPTIVPFLPNFNGTFSFNSLARIQNNAPSAISVALGNPLLEFSERDQYYFVQDDFKPRPNLTLNLGVRYEYTGQPINQLNDLTVARESNASTAFFNPSLPLDQRVVPRIPSDKNNFAPRVGFAWSPRPSGGFLKTLFGENATVLRGGYSWAYEPAFYNILVNILSNTPSAISLTVAQNLLNSQTTSPLPLPNSPIGTNVRANAQSAGVLATGVLNPIFLNVVDVSSDFHAPHSEQWSFGVQRQLGRNHIFEARYVGNRGVDLFQNINGNFFIGPLVNGFSLNRTATGRTNVPGGCASIGSPATCFDFPSFASQLPTGTVSQVCTDVAGTLDNEGACNNRQFRRGNLTTRSNDGFSTYHSLQTRYNGRLINDSLRIGASYTFSKTIDNASEIFSFGDIASPNAQNPFCLRECEKGLSNLNRPHAFSANFLFDVPFFKEQRGFVGRVLGGWQINSTYILTSGAAYTPSNNVAGTYGLGNTYLTAGDRSFIGNTSVDRGLVAISQVDAFLVFGPVTAPISNVNGFWLINDLNNGVLTAVTPNDVYYVINGPGSARIFGTPFGDASRNTEVGPIFNQFNLSVFKNIRVAERVRLQFRAEAFNAFNHPNPGVGVASGGSFGTINLTNAGVLGNQFANDTDITLANRVIQFGLRITF
ncbi:MAG: carboxypeptidase regulatory-like domain-containing protein [Pyrinomonadaceae bacterium]